MAIWISRRRDPDLAAELNEIRSAAGPLAGMRLAVNDNVDVAGLPTTAGCPQFAYLPDIDAVAVAVLRGAGAVVVGKTNLDQFGAGLVGTRSPYGVVPDSRRPEFISGGPSSGSAVAVATGEADIAIATDAAGCVPAALQGIVGIKPTVGLIGTDGVGPALESGDGVAILAATLKLADTATAVLAAGAPARPWPADVRLAAPPVPVVAIPDELPHLDGPWRAAFDAAVDTLVGRGARVVSVDIKPFLAAATVRHGGALLSENTAAIINFIDSQPAAALDPAVRGIITAARDVPAHRLLRDRAEVRRLRDRAMAALAGTDALLVPTVPMHPSLADAMDDPIGIGSRLGMYTSFCNLFDMCAVAVPAGMAGDAQFGVTVLARAFDDAVALDVAALLAGEDPPASPWPLAAAETVELVVFGAHLRGGPLVHQLTDRGARFAGEITTAPRYKMTALPTTPPKPGVTRVPDGVEGAALTGHRWLLSPAALGWFLAALPAPMQLGAVEFADGSWRTAFGCDASVQGIDISSHGSWTTALAAGAVGQT